MFTRGKLAAIFAEARAGSTADDALESLDALLIDALSRARAAWPAFAIDDAAFVRHLAERVAPEALDRVAVEDLFLACACAAQDARAMIEFDRRYLAEVAGVLERSGVAAAAVADTLQLVRTQLLMATAQRRAAIADYGGRGSLSAWLRVVALRQASKVRRDDARHRTLSESAVAAARLPASDPEIATLRRRYGPMTRDALRRGLAALDPQERTVLKLHFVDDLNLEAIAAVLGLSRATVGRRMLAARERVLAEAVRILGAELHATPTEVKSLFGLLRAELEITLGGVVAEAP